MRTQESQRPNGAEGGTLIGICLLASASEAYVCGYCYMKSSFEPSVGAMAVFNTKRLGSDILPNTMQVAVAN